MRPKCKHRNKSRGEFYRWESVVRSYRITTCRDDKGEWTYVSFLKKRFLLPDIVLKTHASHKHEDQAQAVLMHDKIVHKFSKNKTLFLRDQITGEKFTVPE